MRTSVVSFAAAAVVLGAACTDRSGLDLGGGGGAPAEDGGTANGGSPGTGGKATGGSGGTAGAGAGGMAGGGAGGRGGTPGRDAGPPDTGPARDAGADRLSCGPVCAIFCPYDNVLDDRGCPTCKCNPTPTCTEKDCGPAPGAPSILCSDGSTSGFVCERRDNRCGWFHRPCPATACSKEECEKAPRPALACAPGQTGTWSCARTNAGQCGWTLTCSPAACTKESCAALPVPDAGCPPDRIQRNTCARTAAGGCGWSTTCEPVAPLPECGTWRDRASCDEDTRCRWLEPGCTEPTLAAAGCYARADIGCASSAVCSPGRQCLERVINPCLPASPGGLTCGACGMTIKICL